MIFEQKTIGEVFLETVEVANAVYESIFPWIITALGIIVAFEIARKIISLFKHATGSKTYKTGKTEPIPETDIISSKMNL